MSAPPALHPALLRPTLIHILRAAGFTTTRPSVLDTLVDLTSRYLTLLATHTARHAQLRIRNGGADILLDDEHNASQETGKETEVSSDIGERVAVQDIRMAIHDAGGLYPQMSEMEELATGEEDMRGLQAFLAWCTGPANKEIRRIAGLESEDSSADLANPQGGNVDATGAAAAAGQEGLVERKEDFLQSLMKKHAKTEEGVEGRWRGTVLGKDGGGRPVKIEGWEVDSLEGWKEWVGRSQGKGVIADESGQLEERSASASSSPLSSVGTL
ncbi:hypothetical protein MMC21_008286 [Puttea exsequens]|nr:hypothetical protein [Puttea exsequens]